MKISPSGPKPAKIAIVGEAPGQQEELQRRFFCGSSGHLLDVLLTKAGIPRSICYVTNVSKERPPGNDFKARYYTTSGEPSKELLQLHSELIEELQEVQPNVVVALGNEALFALTGKQLRIGDWRGSIIPSPVGKVIPTYHPARILRQWDYFIESCFDFARIRQDMEFPDLCYPQFLLRVRPTFDIVRTFFDAVKNFPYVAVDIETVNHEIDCIAFSHTHDYSICIPLMYLTGEPYWSPMEEAIIWNWIAEVMSSNRIGKVLQNATFDVTYLERHGIPFENLAMDTMCAHHVCYCEAPKSLDFLCSVYTRIPFYKDQSKSNRWEYNAKDALVTRMCFDALNREMEMLGVREFYYSLVNKIILPYREIADTGVVVDLEMKKKISEKLREKKERLTEEINRLAGFRINPDSPKQVADLLYNKLKIRPRRNRTTGSVTTDEDALRSIVKEMAKWPDREAPKVRIPEIMLEFRSTSKLLSTYAEAEVDPDGRLRTTYYVSGTATGRLSSQQTIYKTGVNMQNLVKGEIEEGCGFGIRSFILPDDSESVFVEGDLAGADARVVAWDAEEKNLMELFRSGEDVHTVNAMRFFKIPREKVTKEIRQKAKNGVHAGNYGVGPRTLANTLGVTEEEAMRILDAYYSLYPGIKEWQRKIQEQLKINRTLVTPLGRRRTFFGRWGEELFKEAYAYKPQSVVADVIHIGFLRLYKKVKELELDKQGTRIAMNNHDAINVSCKRSMVDTFLPIMKECMEVVVPFPHENLIIPIEFSIGKNWFEMEKIKV